MPRLVGDRYEIVRELDRGGMGEVLLARQVNLGRLVVIKQVLEEHPQHFVDALREEALIAARLVHPNIVSVLDVSGEGERAFVAMEYVAGFSLRALISQAPAGLPVEVALTIAIDVLRGLAYAHEVEHGDSVGVVHRDVKPRNVMVTVSGVSKLIDFGISRWLAKDGSHEITSVSGTQGYMAPEQAERKAIDARADEYAAGITLREMLTGAPPDDDERTAGSRITRGTIEPALAAVVAKATSTDRGQRFASCAELADELAAYAKARGLDIAPVVVERWLSKTFPERIDKLERELERASAPSVRRVDEPVDPPTVHEKPPTIATVQDKPTRRTISEGERIASPHRARGKLVAGLAGLALVGGGVYLATRSTTPPPAVEVGPLTVDVSAVGDDPTLGLAIEHLARRALRDAPDRRFWVAHERTATRIAITFQAVPTGIRLDARGPGVEAEATGPSVHAAIATLAASLVPALGKDRVDPGPDAHERARMTTLGAQSYDEFRRFRILFEEVREPGWFDTTDAIAGYEALVRDDPAWGHPYAELSWLYGRTTPKAKQVLAAANAKVDPKRGAGLTLIRALDIETEQTQEAARTAISMVEPIVRADSEDLLAGEVLNSAYLIARREDDAAAVARRQYELTPALFYAGDVSDDLQKEGRADEAERLIRDCVARYPESLTASRELARLQARKGELAAAKATAARMLLIHGDRTLALAEIYEAMLAAEELMGAQRLVDRMLRGSKLSQVRGRYRTAVIATFEGRFAAAYRSAGEALDSGVEFGREAEGSQVVQLLVALGPMLGDKHRAITLLQQAADRWDSVGDVARGAGLRYRAGRLDTGRCPSIEVIAHITGSANDREVRRSVLRAAALDGCAPCKDVVDAGFQISETSAASLLAFGRCARQVRELALARRAFERATAMWSSWNNSDASPYHAILAYYELGETLVALGDKPAAKAAYARFLRAWGHADRAIPEVAAAERALKSL